MHVTDIEVEMQLKQQEVAVLQQAMEQLTQEREAENRELMANSGKHIEDVSDRQKRRKLAKFRESATKALWFAETFGLEIESITAKTASSGKELLIPLHSERGNHPSTAPSSSPSTSKALAERNSQSNVMQTLYLLERFGVSDEFYHELTQVRSILLLSAMLCVYIPHVYLYRYTLSWPGATESSKCAKKLERTLTLNRYLLRSMVFIAISSQLW